MTHPPSRRRARRAAALAVLLLLLPAVVAACATGGGARQGVRSSEFLSVDGAELFLRTRGADRRAPVLLWLHGGPGGAQRPLFQFFVGDLEDDFVVAYWDQRGAGRSFDPEADPRGLTIDRHVADLDAVVDHLCRRFDRTDVILVGHSWGGTLGLVYAREHPDKVSALVGVAPLITAVASQRSAQAFVRAEATARADDEALARLRQIGEPPFDRAEEMLVLSRLTDRFGGVFHQPQNWSSVVVRGILRGLVTPWEIRRLIRANEVSLEAMGDELLGVDLAQSVPRVDVPVLFLLGRYDRLVDSRIAARYLEALRAPSKREVWFEHSAHNVPFEEPQRFLETLVRELAPKANAPATRDGASYVPSTSASLRSRKLRSAPVPTRSSARR
jgi:pimeloyl-ACP methyl ester carboxylesterase